MIYQAIAQTIYKDKLFRWESKQINKYEKEKYVTALDYLIECNPDLQKQIKDGGSWHKLEPVWTDQCLIHVCGLWFIQRDGVLKPCLDEKNNIAKAP